MSELLVIGYDNAETAEAARKKLFELSSDYYADVGDAVVAVADENGKVHLRQMVNPWALGAMSGSFWGLLIGAIFLNPLFGIVVGGAAGAAAGALSDYGIRDEFMKEIAATLAPGRAALFMMARNLTSDRVITHLADYGGTVLRTNLSSTDEAKLREIFVQAQKLDHVA
ncbi:hypothetical protein CKO11_04550 [Rhodobacter sp. TJ_12]|uniref:DUF1269 domain-containing protein n=1 Tax=Rhodobacter sp. TJ_12 TaxID=2029399 RepID=UPI001CBD290B|nr:DUF1269 domain-containing protein [Rhodobacter sp. TJ_12]MBZ4021729.1 hypothetical protein [Rhodobacter sp. TJ_12]